MRRSNLLLAMLGLVTLMASLWVWVAVDPSAADPDASHLIEAPSDADAPVPPAFARDAEPIAPAEGAPGAAGLTDAAPPPGPDRADLSALAILAGRVTRVADGSPVVGITLEPRFSTKELVPGMSRPTTDADGRYRFALAENGTLHWLTAPATADTTRTRVHDDIRLRLGETATLDVELFAGATLVGIVVDGQTRPVPGATVMGWSDALWNVDNWPDRAALPDRTVTADSLGRFTISNLGPQFVLTAEAPELTCRWRLRGELPEGARTEGVTLQMSAARHAPGRVLGPLELPLADVNVTAKISGTGSRDKVTGIEGVFRIGPAPRSEQTDGGGRFLLGPLADSNYVVTAKHEDHPPWTGGNSPGQAEMLIRLARGATLRGRLLSANGDAEAGAQLQLSSADELRYYERASRTTRSHDDGHFELVGLLADEHGVLAVLADDHAVHIEQPVVLAEDGTHELDIVLDAERALTGTVVDVDGAPVAGAIVRIEGDRVVDYGDVTMSPVPTWESRFGGLSWTRSDEQGAFRLGQLYDGLFEIEVTHPEDEELVAMLSARSGEDDLVVVLDPNAQAGVTLIGHVRDALTGRPVESFTITPMIPKGVGGMTGSGRQFEREDGSFRITGLEPGPMMINAGAQGYARWSQPLQDYTSGEHLIDVQLHATRTLHVRVLDSMRKPVSGASLTYLDRDLREMFVASGMSSGTTRLSTDEKGEAIAMGLPADHLTVRVKRSFLGGRQDFIFDLRDEPHGVQELVLGDGEDMMLLLVLLTGEAPDGMHDSGGDPEDTLTRILGALAEGTARPLNAVAQIEVRDGGGLVVADRPFDPDTSDPIIKLQAPGVDRGWMTSLTVPSEPLNVTVSAPGYVTEQRSWQPDRTGVSSQVLVVFLQPE